MNVYISLNGIKKPTGKLHAVENVIGKDISKPIEMLSYKNNDE